MTAASNILAADEGTRQQYMGLLLNWKATAQQTANAFSLVEACGATGSEPPLHFHLHADEFFYVIAGTMTFKVGNEIKQISDGGFVWIPRTVVHGFLIESKIAKFLFGFVPAGIEQMFAEMVEGHDGNLSAAADRNREQFGTIVAGPPLSLKVNPS